MWEIQDGIQFLNSKSFFSLEKQDIHIKILTTQGNNYAGRQEACVYGIQEDPSQLNSTVNDPFCEKVSQLLS